MMRFTGAIRSLRVRVGLLSIAMLRSRSRSGLRLVLRNFPALSWLLLALIAAGTFVLYFAQMKFQQLELLSNQARVVMAVTKRVGVE
ncbi:MAG TPA: hypothetical protein VN812_13345, partial [Candidatus Acidoferrales bacterium]|nr:hypothetical protein [Candidatus Acidoferrales bacterium]